MADLTDDIRARIGIVELVSQYVQLKKTGRNYKGLCPFHSEKTPSFIVSPEKQLAHCFGCGKGGDVFGFIMEKEGVTFVEALNILADRAGIKIENVSKYQKKGEKSEKDEYFKANDLACSFYEKQLHGTSAGKKVLEYLHKRGLNAKTIEEFSLGYAPDAYDQLYPYLLEKKGISKKVLIKSGLVSAKNLASDEIYDKFRCRLMFPIFDYFGRICGFGGRTLKEEQMPKYLNSPESPVYEKGKILYGLSQAKDAIKEKDKIVLVEGYFDVILPFQSGVKNIAAVSGTALTSDQVRLIKRLTPNVVACFDTDKAGYEASKRAYFLLSEEGMNIKAVSGLDKKDPADFVNEGKGSFEKLVDEAPEFVSFYIDKLVGEHDTSVFGGRDSVLRELLPVYKLMPASARDFYIRELSKKMSINEKSLYDEIDRYSLPNDHPAREAAMNGSKLEKKISTEEVFLAIILEHPTLFPGIGEMLSKEDFNEEMKDIYNELADQYNSVRAKFGNWDFDDEVLAKHKEKIDILVLYAQEAYGEFSEESLEVELKKLIDRMRKDRKSRKLNEIRLKINTAEESSDKKRLVELLKEQQELLRD